GIRTCLCRHPCRATNFTSANRVAGYRRFDGLFDIEARMIDTKTQERTLESGRMVPRGKPLHDMSIRLVVDEDLNVVDLVAATDAAHDTAPASVAKERASAAPNAILRMMRAPFRKYATGQSVPPLGHGQRSKDQSRAFGREGE
ncbi:MAG: DUF2889 domain-containing protein, partial [Betaproteobacteria bacterium]